MFPNIFRKCTFNCRDSFYFCLEVFKFVCFKFVVCGLNEITAKPTYRSFNCTFLRYIWWLAFSCFIFSCDTEFVDISVDQVLHQVCGISDLNIFIGRKPFCCWYRFIFDEVVVDSVTTIFGWWRPIKCAWVSNYVGYGWDSRRAWFLCNNLKHLIEQHFLIFLLSY